MNTLTPADIIRLAAEVKAKKVRASATGSSDKLSYIIYDEEGNPDYLATLAHALCTIPGVSEINKQRLLAIYLTSSAGGYDDLYRMIESLRNTTNTLASDIKAIEAQLGDVDDAINQISTLKTQLAELQSLYTSLNRSLNSLTETVSTIETLIDNLDIEDLDNRITSNSNRIDNLEADNVDIKNRVTALEEGGSGGGSDPNLVRRVTQLETDVDKLNTQLEEYDTLIEQLQYNIQQANQKATNAENTANGLSSKVNKNTSDITSINSSINGIKSDITAVNKRIDDIATGGGVDLSEYVTRTEMTNTISSMFSSLRGSTIYNLHIIGWHNDIELEFNPEQYPDATTGVEYQEQFGIIAAKEITTKEQLLSLNVSGGIIARWLDEIMHCESIDDLYNNMSAHSIYNSIGYGKPKANGIRKVGDKIYIDSYWDFDDGFLARCEVSLAGVKFTKLLDLKELEERLTKLEEDNEKNKQDIATLQSDVNSLKSRVGNLESTSSNHESRISALERG